VLDRGQGQRGVVRFGDSRHDGQAKADPIVGGGPAAGSAAARLAQADALDGGSAAAALGEHATRAAATVGFAAAAGRPRRPPRSAAPPPPRLPNIGQAASRQQAPAGQPRPRGADPPALVLMGRREAGAL
jgi:hypothetical protein